MSAELLPWILFPSFALALISGLLIGTWIVRRFR